MTFRIEKITPEKAKEYLDSKPHENTAQSIVDLYKDAMERGDFTIFASPIVFDKEGNIIDGLHKLVAIAQGSHTVDAPIVIDENGCRRPHLFSC